MRRPLLLALLCTLPSRGDVVVLKDGYAIHGKVSDEKTVIFDNLTGEPIVVRKANGFDLIDDGARWVVFSAHAKRIGDVSDFNKFADFVALTHTNIHGPVSALPPVGNYVSGSEWGSDWRRVVKYRALDRPGMYAVGQQIVTLTPHYIRIDSYTHRWSSNYLTREWDVNVIRKLLGNHAELRDWHGIPFADRRARIVRFLIQAGFRKEAEAEIVSFRKLFPDAAKQADELLAQLNDRDLEAKVETLERARDAGRHAYARQGLAALPRDNPPDKLAVRIAALRAEYEDGAARRERMIVHLRAYAALPATEIAGFGPILTTIADSLHHDTASRLDPFLTLADQAEKAKAAGRAGLQTPAQVCAAAVSGWLLGKSAVDTNPATAQKLLKARTFAEAYLRTDSAIKRRDMAGNYRSETTDALPYDELERLITLLPPITPETDLTPAVRTGTVDQVNYALKLPPEYAHGRAYPLLVVLPHPGVRGADLLREFGDIPGKFGFIVAACDWSTPLAQSYTFTAEEQKPVLKLMRHLNRTLQIDSDRIFLLGHGEGATMALDVAASHPDLFAGVLPMCPSIPRPDKAPSPGWVTLINMEYYQNFYQLPTYMIMGDRAGERATGVVELLKKWMPKGFPALAVTYKGRGFDWYIDEMPFAFDWMSRKKRAGAGDDAITNIGGPVGGFRLSREGEGRFFWLEAGERQRGFTWDPSKKGNPPPALLGGRITEGEVNITQRGLVSVTVKFGKGMIDYARPVSITIGEGSLKRQAFQGRITPRLEVLMEDVYERGDRQRPYFAKVEIGQLNGVPRVTAGP